MVKQLFKFYSPLWSMQAAVTEQVRGKRAVESMIIDRELKNGLLVRKKRNK